MACGCPICRKEVEDTIKALRNYRMTDAEREQQRRSFAYGNAHLHNQDVTREMVDKAADELANEDEYPQPPAAER